MAFVFGLLSCSQKKRPPAAPVAVLQCLNCTEEPSVDFPPYRSLRIVKLETNPSCLIAHVKQVETSDYLIFVLDAERRLFVFDGSGALFPKQANMVMRRMNMRR